LENFFPIIGKLTKIFSNHWKKRPDFSNHWKNIFQSLENRPFPGGLPDWPKPGRLDPVPGGQAAFQAAPGRASKRVQQID